MSQNEVIYKTNLDFQNTVEQLRSIPDMKVLHEPGMRPSGIAYIKWRTISCNIGAKGGIQIHYDRREDRDSFVELLKTKISYRKGESSEWIQTKGWLGRTYYKDTTAELLDTLEEATYCLGELSNVPRRHRTNSIDDRTSYSAASLVKELSRCRDTVWHVNSWGLRPRSLTTFCFADIPEQC